MNPKSNLFSAGATFAALLFSPTAAQAQESTEEAAPARLRRLPLSLRLEPGLAVALTEPQSRLTDAGFGQTVKLFIGLARYLEVGASATFTTLPATEAMADAGADPGTAWSFGAGARLVRPHDTAPGRRGFAAMAPWLDADALYVRTGALDRVGFAGAVGLAVPLGDRRRAWLGPFVRYLHIVQGERVGFDNRDAKLLSIGLSLELGPGLAPARRVRTAVEPPVEPPVEQPPEQPAVTAAADRDGDGVIDLLDRCPEVSGLAINSGCPPYEQVAVLPDKLEVKQKIAFGWDSATLDEGSHPALDEVARVLQENPSFRVEVEGHASSDGADDHNQSLSEARASSVLGYLMARGIAKERLSSRGLSSSSPVQSNETLAGRQRNRRVEFSVHFIILSDASQRSTP